jgi:Holliday junction resolvase RusA-like endonuclease
MIAGHIRTYTPTTHPVNAFKAAVQAALSASGHAEPLSGPLSLDVLFVMPRPLAKIWKTRPMPRYRHAKKPDLDNLLKSLKDALTGLAWRDDAQVDMIHAIKCTAAGDELPHVRVVIEEVE